MLKQIPTSFLRTERRRRRTDERWRCGRSGSRTSGLG